MDVDKTSHLAVLAAVSVAVGNTWYAFHRFFVHQLLDVAFYVLGLRGPAATRPWTWDAFSNYCDDLGRYVTRSFTQPAERQPLREHIEFRASTVVVMYIAAQAVFAGAMCPEPDTVYDRYRLSATLWSSVGFIGATWQNIITRRIDWYCQNQPEKPISS